MKHRGTEDAEKGQVKSKSNRERKREERKNRDSLPFGKLRVRDKLQKTAKAQMAANGAGPYAGNIAAVSNFTTFV